MVLGDGTSSLLYMHCACVVHSTIRSLVSLVQCALLSLQTIVMTDVIEGEEGDNPVVSERVQVRSS